MGCYAAYGLTFRSDHPLPFAQAPDDSEADILIDYAGGACAGPPIDSAWRVLERDGPNWCLRFANHKGGWVSYDYDRSERRLRIAGSVAWEDALPALLGAVCATLLGLEGRTLLHGAALRLGDGAVAILGDGGTGKSTLAATLHLAGASLLSEDLLRFEGANGDVAVYPGHRLLSLLPDTHAFVGSPEADLRDGVGKYWLDTESTGTDPVRLRAIFILAAPDPALTDSRADRLPAPEAAMTLMRHLYGPDWIRSPEPADLAFCTQLAAAIPVFDLARPAGLEHVAETALLIERIAKHPEDHR